MCKCFRAGCGFKGFVGFDKLTGYIGTAPAREKRHKTFTGDINPIPQTVLDALRAKFELDDETLKYYRVGWSYDTNRLILPILGPGFSSRGISARLMERLVGVPKVLAFRDLGLPDNVPLLGWYEPLVPISRLCFVVEDQISAMKIAGLGYPAVALVGSDLSMAKAVDIQKIYSKLVIFLDADALDKAFSAQKKVGWLFEYTGILFDKLKRDPKDIPLVELEKILRKQDSDFRDQDSSSGDSETGYVGQD